MSYFDLYKKNIKKNGNTTREVRENISKQHLDNNFELALGYNKGILKRVGELEHIDFDFVVQSTAGELQKIFMFRPNEFIEVGSYVSYKNKTYIIRDFDDDLLSPTAKGFYCNQQLNFIGLKDPIPCWASNSTYGSKGVIDVEYFYTLDSKLKVYIQSNKYTDTLNVGNRIMFANKYVYKITEIDNIVFGNGMYVLVAQRDELMPMDNLDKNIAWNEYEEDMGGEVIVGINGAEKIVLNSVSTYSAQSDVEWSVDDNDLAEIVNATPREVTILGKKRGWLTLVATIKNEEIKKNIMIC